MVAAFGGTDKMKLGYAVAALACLSLTACQSSSTSTPQAAQPAASAPDAKAAFAPPAAAAPAQCVAPIAGPPPKPNKGGDFASATTKNVGKNVGRNVLAGIGGRVAGPIGGAVAGGLAMEAIRSEQDLKGQWTATDGAPTCGCTLDISSGVNLQGRTVYSGKLASRDCANPLLARVAKWNLGHTFTGYDASFDLTAADGTKLASLKRDGVDYFSGVLADGTPVTIWRQ